MKNVTTIRTIIYLNLD